MPTTVSTATLERLRSDIESRVTSEIRITETVLAADDRSLDKLLAPGSIVVILTRAGSPALAQLRQLIRTDRKAANALCSRLAEALKKRSSTSISDAVKKLAQMPVVASIHHRGRELAAAVPVPSDVEAVILTFPYNGGKIDRAGLTLRQHRVVNSTAALEAHAIRRHPELTGIERAAVEMVADDQLQLNVGSAAFCSGGTLVAMALLVHAVTRAVGCGNMGRFDPVTHPVPDFKIKELGTNATAIELLNLRRELLEKR